VRVALGVLLPTVAVVCGFFAAVALLVVRAQLRRPLTGAAAMVGAVGVVRQALAPRGKVFVNGELWNATARAPIAVNSRVRVIAVQGLTLEVEALAAERPAS
jgi:membrane-bound serine protease (ClpP class)